MSKEKLVIMNKEFVPYDIALAMRELGFDEPCLGIYYNREDGVKYLEPTWEFIIGKGLNNENEVNAPLYQQAFRWFRSKYGLYTGISPYNVSLDLYEIIIKDKEDNDYEVRDTYGDENSQIVALNELIEIVKENL